LDNLTHTLTGVLLGRAGLKRLTGRATAALVISSNLPDIDSFISPLWGEPSIEAHRGFTHGVGGMVVLPFFTVAIIMLWERLRQGKISIRPGPLLLVAFVGTVFHSAFDWLTSYGTRLLEPFSNQWFYGDAWFIVDPWIWIALIVGLELSWRAERLGRNWRMPSVAMLAIVCVYGALNLGISDRMVAAARSRLAPVHPTMVVANPEPLFFWRRQIEWRNAVVHGSGTYDLLNGLRFDRAVAPNRLDDPRLAEARRTDPEIRAFLFWSRMPVVVERDGKAYLTDQRFSGPSSSRRGGPFLIPLE
jgi:inner membrane protein